MRRAMTSAAQLPCLCALAGALIACGQPGSRLSTYPIVVHAVDDLGQPLPGVQLTAAGHELGATDDKGDRMLNLLGSEGQRVELSATCPPAYDGPREHPSLLLKRTQSLQSPGLQAIELSLTCDAKEHISLIAIRTGQAGLPVRLRGQPVALTSATGTAHVYLKEPVGSSFQLTLDTSERADLHPISPSHIFSIGQRDGFTVWDQPFEVEKKPPKRRKIAKHKAAPPPAPPPPPRHIPERLESYR